MPTEFEKWVAKQPRLPNGKIDGQLLIDESRKRTYCVCPKPIREMVFFDGFNCEFCGQPETLGSWEFYYKEERNGED